MNVSSTRLHLRTHQAPYPNLLDSSPCALQMDQADSGWRANRVLRFESFRLGRRRGGRDDADTRKRTVPLSLTGRRAGARRTSGHRKGRTDSRHGRRIGIGLSSSPPNFNWELTRFPVRCNSRRDATRRPLSPRVGRGRERLVTIVTSSGEILGVLGHRPRIIYLYVDRCHSPSLFRYSLPSFSVNSRHFVRSSSEIPRYGDR